MIPFFPSPYPDELWHSLLCRYHIRNGNLNTLTTRNHEQGSGALFLSDRNIATVVMQLPESFLTPEQAIWAHTLFPYTSRIYSLERKTVILESICNGAVDKLGTETKTVPRTISKLWYCPLCVKDDKETYGESYWHREHQIAYMPICRKHGCRLNEYKNSDKRQLVSNPVLPEFICNEDEPDFTVKPYEKPLADTLYAYLTLPLDVAPAQGYSNLYGTLEQKYQRVRPVSQTIVFDIDRLHNDLEMMYGAEIRKFFPKAALLKHLPLKLRNWKYTTPERYALLAVLIGQTAKETFGKSNKDEYDKSLLRVRELKLTTARQREISRSRDRARAERKAVN